MSETDYEALARKAEESEGKHVPFPERPRFGSKRVRVEFALAKFHGLGSDGSWSITDIADYLRVQETTVEKYLFESDMAAEVEEQIAAAEARTRLRVSQQLQEDLDDLNDLEEELGQEKRAAVTSHRVETIEAPVSIESGNTRIKTEESHRIPVAVPDDYTEVTEIDDLKDVWSEKRKITTQLRQILGLDAPERTESEHREIRHEVKIWDIDDGEFPEAEVIDASAGSNEDPPVSATNAEEDG